MWRRYRRSGDPVIRDRLVFALTPIIKHLVGATVKVAPATHEVDDFLSVGYEALLHAIERFDPQKGAPLDQFAWTRVRGAILDELRRQDWAPRSLRQRQRELDHARDELGAALGRPPTRTELAEELAIDERELLDLERDLDVAQLGSLHAPAFRDEDGEVDRIAVLADETCRAEPEAETARQLAGERLGRAVSSLPERSQRLVRMLYDEGLTQREASRALGVTEARVSQIHADIRRDLRALLADDAELFEDIAA
jgi:RNA polymerase sigma factor for flagellar operon FliA